MTTVKARHLLFVLLLQEHGKQTAATLGKWMDVHARTVSRHADDLQQMGVKVQSVKGAHGGFALDRRARVRLDSFVQSSSGGHSAAGPDELSLRLEMREIIERLPAELRPGIHARIDQMVRDNVPAGVPASQRAQLITLRRALWSNTRVVALIRRAQQVAEWRAMDPLVVTCHGDTWYLVGVCADQRNVRVFDLNEIEDVNLLDQSAVPPDVLDARRPAW